MDKQKLYKILKGFYYGFLVILHLFIYVVAIYSIVLIIMIYLENKL